MDLVFDSGRLPPAERIEAWEEVTARAMTRTRFTIGEPAAFSASIRAMSVGAGLLCALSYTALRSTRTADMIRKDDPEHYASPSSAPATRPSTSTAGRTGSGPESWSCTTAPAPSTPTSRPSPAPPASS